jgi:hypothetical protein
MDQETLRRLEARCAKLKASEQAKSTPQARIDRLVNENAEGYGSPAVPLRDNTPRYKGDARE